MANYFDIDLAMAGTQCIICTIQHRRFLIKCIGIQQTDCTNTLVTVLHFSVNGIIILQFIYSQVTRFTICMTVLLKSLWIIMNN